MLEKSVENHFVWTVERLGGVTFKFKSPTQRGVSDRIACMPNGETWFVELKRPKGGRLSPLQVRFRDEVQKLQQKYLLATNYEEIDLWASAYRTRCLTA